MKQILNYLERMFKSEQPKCLQATLSASGIAYDDFTEHPGIDRHLKRKLENPERYDAGIIGFRLDSIQAHDSKETRTRLIGRVITQNRYIEDTKPQFHRVDLVFSN
jgi:hypothetical protein